MVGEGVGREGLEEALHSGISSRGENGRGTQSSVGRGRRGRRLLCNARAQARRPCRGLAAGRVRGGFPTRARRIPARRHSLGFQHAAVRRHARARDRTRDRSRHSVHFRLRHARRRLRHSRPQERRERLRSQVQPRAPAPLGRACGERGRRAHPAQTRRAAACAGAHGGPADRRGRERRARTEGRHALDLRIGGLGPRPVFPRGRKGRAAAFRGILVRARVLARGIRRGLARDDAHPGRRPDGPCLAGGRAAVVYRHGQRSPRAPVGPVAQERDTGGVRVSGGVGQDYIGLMPLGLDESRPEQFGLAGRAVKERRVVIAGDVAKDSRIDLRGEALARGLRSLAVLPLFASERPVGVLALYADVPGFFDAEDEMRLLLELAGDIGFAIDHIEKAERLNYLAYYDPLTGLANATLFRDRLARFMDAAREAGHKLALGIVDVDRFKTINDSLGRPAGDDLLKQIARRMSGHSKESSEIARVAADRFTVVLPRLGRGDNVARLAEQRVADVFGMPFLLGAEELRVSAKVGIAMFPEDGADAETLFKNAEAALNKAKESNEPYLFYTQKLTERVAERLSLENQLRQALEKNEFVLHYQPKVETQTRRIVGVEALIRWMSPERGLVPPLEFIPLLEETGL